MKRISAAALVLFTIATASAATPPRVHKLVIQISSANPATIQLALNNAQNVFNYFLNHHGKVKVEIVAFGPGLSMLRESTSHVKNEIKDISEDTLGAVRFSACHNTIKAVEAQIGHPVHLVPQAVIVPGGVVRIMHLEANGYAYIDATTH